MFSEVSKHIRIIFGTFSDPKQVFHIHLVVAKAKKRSELQFYVSERPRKIKFVMVVT